MTSVSHTDYTIPKPLPSIVVWLLGLLVVAGVTTLGLAAFHAFSQVVQPAQALFASFVIEAGMIVEALALVRARRARDLILPLLGVIISVAVSATYNYTQVSLAAREIQLTDQIQLLALALGPLAAIVFLAVNLGRELRRHEQAVGQWESDRQTWLDSERTRLAIETTAVAHREKARQDRLALKIEKIRTSNAAQTALESLRQDSGNMPNSPEHAERFPKDWRKLSDDQKRRLYEMTSDQIVTLTGLSDRGARVWKSRLSANGFHTEPAHEN